MTTKMTQPRSGEAPLRGKAMFDDILCAVDGTQEALAAIEQAAALAGPNGHVTLLEVTSFEVEGSHRGPEIVPAEATRIIQRAAQTAEKSGVPFTEEVDPDTPPSQVVLHWASERDLLALGAPTHGLAGWDAQRRRRGHRGGLVHDSPARRPLGIDERAIRSSHPHRKRRSPGL